MRLQEHVFRGSSRHGAFGGRTGIGRSKGEFRRVKTYALLHEVPELSLVLDLDQLLAAIGRVGDVQLHLD
jgi:hypothetical protein